MIDEIFSQIEVILKETGGKPLLKTEIVEKLQASYNYGGSPRKVERALTSLKEDGVVELVPIQAKRQGKVFTTLGWVHSSAILKKGTETETEHDKIRLFHTEAIKEKVIKPWIEQLPDIYIDGPYKIITHKDNIDGEWKRFSTDSEWKRFFTYDYITLEVEKELLFEDFKKHISFYPNPFELLKNLKFKTWYDLHPLSLQFEVTAKKTLSNYLLKNTRYHNYLPDHNPTMIAFIDLVKLKIIDDYLKEMPIKLGSEILLQDYYQQLYDVVNYIIQIPSKAGNNNYRIDGVIIDYWNSDKYKKSISSKIKSALDKVVIYCLTPPKECQSAGVEIAKKLVELYDIKQQLVKVLQQHLERNILAGECGYTTP